MTSVVLFSKDEAKRETAALKRAIARIGADTSAVMARLAEAEHRELWRAAGYRSMARYVTDALGMSRPNAYRVLDQVHSMLALGAPKVSRSETESEQLPPPPIPTQREAADLRAEYKQKRPKRGMPNNLGMIRAAADAIDNLEYKLAAHEPEEVIAWLDYDERKAFDRLVTKASEFSEKWTDLLARPIERRYIEESA